MPSTTNNPATAPRIDWASFDRLAPAIAPALAALGKAVDDSGLDKPLTELMKIRASQLNGCAYCLQYHLNIARRLAVDSRKVDLVATWRDAPVFDARERAALAWTEALTLMPNAHVGDQVYALVAEAFSAQELPFLTAAVAAINAWNRIAGALRFAPPLAPVAPSTNGQG